MRRRGFTLIELLIVVAIIALLAAIAVPNFLEAQTRAKAARVRSDLRVLALALERYCVDHDRYPRQHGEASCIRVTTGLPELSTPVAYLSTFPDDVFAADCRGGSPLQYMLCTDGRPSYTIWSVGPDRTDQAGMVPYDPTNGTISEGDI